MLTDAATSSDPKARDLARMRVLATGLLLLMALIYVAASAAAHANPALVPALGYVRASPILALLRGMIPVCGMGSPRGRRNSAVTANQSAQAPAMPASAKART